MKIIAVIFCIINVIVSEEEKVFKVSGLDSYLEAYRESQSESANSVKKSDTDYNEFAGYPYPSPQNHYGPPVVPNYGSPRYVK